MNTTTKTTGLAIYYPEMDQARPEAAEIDARLSHYGRHVYLKTPLVLKGRGIVHIRMLRAADLTPPARHKAGWHEYKVTQRAFDQICERHFVAMEKLL